MKNLKLFVYLFLLFNSWVFSYEILVLREHYSKNYCYTILQKNPFFAIIDPNFKYLNLTKKEFIELANIKMKQDDIVLETIYDSIRFNLDDLIKFKYDFMQSILYYDCNFPVDIVGVCKNYINID